MNASSFPRRGLPLVLGSLVPVLLILALCADSAEGAAHCSAPDTLRWTSALSMRYHAIQGTALSPDGSLVAYVVREPVMEGEKSEYRSQIWVVPSAGAQPRQYTRGEYSASNPAFSPDGRFLAFTSGRSGKNQVWVMPVDGGEAAQATDAENGVGSFAWAPDGENLAFTMGDPETEEEKAAKSGTSSSRTPPSSTPTFTGSPSPLGVPGSRSPNVSRRAISMSPPSNGLPTAPASSSAMRRIHG